MKWQRLSTSIFVQRIGNLCIIAHPGSLSPHCFTAILHVWNTFYPHFWLISGVLSVWCKDSCLFKICLGFQGLLVATDDLQAQKNIVHENSLRFGKPSIIASESSCKLKKISKYLLPPTLHQEYYRFRS